MMLFSIVCYIFTFKYVFVCSPRPREQMVINTMCGQGMQELEYNEAGNYIHANGCIDKLVNWIHSNLFLLGGIALGLAIPQVEKYGAWHSRQQTHFA